MTFRIDIRCKLRIGLAIVHRSIESGNRGTVKLPFARGANVSWKIYGNWCLLLTLLTIVFDVMRHILRRRRIGPIISGHIIRCRVDSVWNLVKIYL